MNNERERLKLRYRAALAELDTLDLLWVYCRLRYLLARQAWRRFVIGWAVRRLK